MLAQQGAQVLAVELGGAGGGGDVAVGAVHQGPQVAALEVLEERLLGGGVGLVELQLGLGCGFGPVPGDLPAELGEAAGAGGEGDGAVDGVAQLADVAGPGLGGEAGEGGALDVGDGEAAQLQQGADDRCDVLAAGSQGREADADDAEAVVEVGAQGAAGDGRGEVALGCGDDPDVDRLLAVAADGADGAGLEGAQEAGLEVEREGVELVEEEGAAVGPGEGAAAGLQGAGEGAADVAEELALDEVLREGAAVDGDEGAAPARAGVVDRPGGELLAGAGLALEQDGDVGGGGELEHGEDLAHDQAGADQLAEAVRAAGVDLQLVRLGLDPQGGAADPEGGAGGDLQGGQLRALVEGAVGAAEVLDQELTAGLGADPEVLARDAAVAEGEGAGAVAADGDGGEAEGDGAAHVGAVDDDELAADAAAAARVVGVLEGDRGDAGACGGNARSIPTRCARGTCRRRSGRIGCCGGSARAGWPRCTSRSATGPAASRRWWRSSCCVASTAGGPTSSAC